MPNTVDKWDDLEIRITTKRAAAYIRRSSADDNNPGDVSKEAQLSTVRAMAVANGIDPDDLKIYEDWGKSADEEKRDKRTAYIALLKAIETRRFEFVFVYHVDRIVRSVADFSELTKVAGTYTTIQAPGLTLTGSDPMAKAFAQIAAVFAELELGRIKQRVHKGFAVRAARGDEFGSFRYGYRTARQPDGSIKWERDPAVPLDRVLEVVAANGGNINASCRDLNPEIPPPRGGKRWGTSALTRIVDREAPKLRTPKGNRPQRQPTKSVLSALVRCPSCGTLLTPVGTRSALYCSHGSRTPGHGRSFVKDAEILAVLHWVTDGRTYTKFMLTRGATTDSAEFEKAQERWRRANVRYSLGGLTDEELRAEHSAWKAVEAAASEEDAWDYEKLVGQPFVHWDADTQTVNKDLRRLFTEVRLEPETFAPLEVIWRDRHLKSK